MNWLFCHALRLRCGTGARTPPNHLDCPTASPTRQASAAPTFTFQDGRLRLRLQPGATEPLAIFSVEQDSGRLTGAGHASTRGNTPRNFTIDPSGAWVLAANQDSDDIGVFSRDADTGQLSPVGDMVWAPMAVCLRFGP